MSDDKSQSSNGSTKNWFQKLVQKITGEPKNKEDLETVIDEAQERDLIDPQTKEMIKGVLEVSEKKVRDIMIPRSQMVTIDINESIDQYLPMVLQSAHSRFPVVNEDKDHVEGILLAKDLLPFAFEKDINELTLESILRKAIVVPETKRVDALLQEFREERYHMAIVVDEYGGVSGLVTIEDILEQIVGEIIDETDDSEPEDIRKLGKHLYSLQALTSVVTFNEYFSAGFNEDEADTIGGVILHAFGHMPTRGETIEIQGFNFKIVNADNRRIQQIQLTVPKKTVTNEAIAE